MPLVFAYGTLQHSDVQQATFGRLLDGSRDELVGFELSSGAGATGQVAHANVTYNGRADSRVAGIAFELTEAELAVADRYEKPAAYVRILVTLASGKQAWVYVHEGSAGRSA